MSDFVSSGELIGGVVGNPVSQRPEAWDCFCTGKRLPSSACPVILEARKSLTAEGRKQLRDEYGQQLRARAQLADTAQDPPDLLYKLQKLGVPHEALGPLRGRLDETAALQGAKRFAGADRDALPFLVLIGPTGAGKSVAAAWMLREAARRFDWNAQATGQEATPFAWVHGSEFGDVKVWSEGDAAWLSKVRNGALLVVDEMGDEATQPSRDALASLLLNRHGKRLRTVLTSNLTREQFRERYGGALTDRLRHGSVTPNLSAETSKRKRVAA